MRTAARCGVMSRPTFSAATRAEISVRIVRAVAVPSRRTAPAARAPVHLCSGPFYFPRNSISTCGCVHVSQYRSTSTGVKIVQLRNLITDNQFIDNIINRRSQLDRRLPPFSPIRNATAPRMPLTKSARFGGTVLFSQLHGFVN